MSFVQGFQAGSQMGKTWVDIYNQANEEARKRKYAEEVSALGVQREMPPQMSPVAEPAPTAAPMLQTARGLGPQPTGYSPVAPTAPTAGLATAAPRVPPQMENIPESEMYRQQAAIAAKYRLADEATRLQGLSTSAGRYESEQARQARLDEEARTAREVTQGILTAEADRAASEFTAKQNQAAAQAEFYASLQDENGMFRALTSDDIGKVMANPAIRNPEQFLTNIQNFRTTVNAIKDEEQRNNATAAVGAINKRLVDGGAVDGVYMNSVMQEFGVTSPEGIKVVQDSVLTSLGVDEAFAEAFTASELRKVESAIRSNTLDQYISQNINTDQDEATKAAVVEKDGKWFITEGGRVIPGYEQGESSRDALVQKLKGNIKGDPYAYTVQRLAMMRDEAQLNYNSAQTQQLLAEAAAESGNTIDMDAYVSMYTNFMKEDPFVNPDEEGNPRKFSQVNQDEKRNVILEALGVTAAGGLGDWDENQIGTGEAGADGAQGAASYAALMEANGASSGAETTPPVGLQRVTESTTPNYEHDLSMLEGFRTTPPNPRAGELTAEERSDPRRAEKAAIYRAWQEAKKYKGGAYGDKVHAELDALIDAYNRRGM